MKFSTAVFLELLQRCPRLSSLNLHGCTLKDEVPQEWAKIFHGIHAHTSVERVELVDMQLGSASDDRWSVDEGEDLTTIKPDLHECKPQKVEVEMLNHYLNHAGTWTQELSSRWDVERSVRRTRASSFWSFW